MIAQQPDGWHIVIPWGCENSFSNAKTAYSQIEAFAKFINDNIKSVTVRMSTPSEYVKATSQVAVQMSDYTSDFFPVNLQDNDVLSGYFSSRPGFKAQVRHVSE